MIITRNSPNVKEILPGHFAYNGNLITDKLLRIELPHLDILGSLKASGGIETEGSLTVAGDIETDDEMYYNGSICAGGNIKAALIYVNGNLKVAKSLVATYGIITCGEIYVARQILSSGHIRSQGTISAGSCIHAGHSIRSYGAIIAGTSIIACSSIYSNSDIQANDYISAEKQIWAGMDPENGGKSTITCRKLEKGTVCNGSLFEIHE